MTASDVPLHRSPVYAVGHCRVWIEALHGMEPHIEMQGNPETLSPEEMRSFAVVLDHLVSEAKPT